MTAPIPEVPTTPELAAAAPEAPVDRRVLLGGLVVLAGAALAVLVLRAGRRAQGPSTTGLPGPEVPVPPNLKLLVDGWEQRFAMLAEQVQEDRDTMRQLSGELRQLVDLRVELRALMAGARAEVVGISTPPPNGAAPVGAATSGATPPPADPGPLDELPDPEPTSPDLPRSPAYLGDELGG